MYNLLCNLLSSVTAYILVTQKPTCNH
jgi:hypothetical protein